MKKDVILDRDRDFLTLLKLKKVEKSLSLTSEKINKTTLVSCKKPERIQEYKKSLKKLYI